MAGVGGVVGGKWRQLYLNNNKKNTNSKMTTNSQLSRTEPGKKTLTTRTGIESQKWRSHGGLSADRRRAGEKA